MHSPRPRRVLAATLRALGTATCYACLASVRAPELAGRAGVRVVRLFVSLPFVAGVALREVGR